MDALTMRQIREWDLEERRREAARHAELRRARPDATGVVAATIRIAAASAGGHHRTDTGRLADRKTRMMQDPLLLADLAKERLKSLRREAAARQPRRPGVPHWRRRAGESLVRVGMRLLDQRVDLIERTAR